MTDEILLDIIAKVEETGFHVVAVVCDLGGPWFLNLADPANKFYVFADVPYLIKLIRNNFVDHGFIINNKIIDKSIIEESKGNSTSELSIAHKISSINLTVNKAKRQKCSWRQNFFLTLCHKQVYAVHVWVN